MLNPQQNQQLALQKDNPFLKFKATYLFFFFILIYLGVVISYAFILGSFDIGFDFDDPIREYITYCLSCVGINFYLLKRLDRLQINSKNIFGKLTKGYRWLSLFGLVFMLLLFALGAGLLSFDFLWLIAPSFFESLLKSISETNSQSSSVPIFYNFLEIVTSVIVAPIAEEFVFRGVLIHAWTAKWGLRSAILLSSLMFGFLHFNPIGVSIAGIIFALLYLKTRTLFVPIVAHAMNNSIVFILPLLATLVTVDPKVSRSGTNLLNYSWQVGLFLITLSTPFIICFIYQK